MGCTKDINLRAYTSGSQTNTLFEYPGKHRKRQTRKEGMMGQNRELGELVIQQQAKIDYLLHKVDVIDWLVK